MSSLVRFSVSLHLQDPVIFAGSLRMNLDPLDNHTDEELWRALEHAHLLKFIETLPDKLNYECGEGGQNFRYIFQLISFSGSCG